MEGGRAARMPVETREPAAETQLALRAQGSPGLNTRERRQENRGDPQEPLRFSPVGAPMLQGAGLLPATEVCVRGSGAVSDGRSRRKPWCTERTLGSGRGRDSTNVTREVGSEAGSKGRSRKPGLGFVLFCSCPTRSHQICPHRPCSPMASAGPLTQPYPLPTAGLPWEPAGQSTGCEGSQRDTSLPGGRGPLRTKLHSARVPVLLSRN